MTFSPSVDMALAGTDVFLNGSASHFELGKLSKRLSLLQNSNAKVAPVYNFFIESLQLGGLYVYSNLLGCDGSNLYYDGASCIYLNGKLLKIGEQFSLNEIVKNTVK